MSALSPKLFGKLIEPGPRLPWLIEWLTQNVWSSDRFAQLSPEDYLTQGEKLVHDAEELLAAAAYRIYNELASEVSATEALSDVLSSDTAVVVFDGASIREAPLFQQKAAESGFRVVESRVSYAAAPSETVDFVEQRLVGKRLGPKQLAGRQEITGNRVKVFYFPDAIASQDVRVEEDEALLLWSSFPDVTYKDSAARFARHFAGMQPLYDAAWKNTVMQIPSGRRIILTSDHGYIFFGAGFESTRPSDACSLLDQHRSKRFGPDEPWPGETAGHDLQLFHDKRMAMVRGRLKNRPKGPSANLIYRHGGFSLMEMLVPWIVLERS